MACLAVVDVIGPGIFAGGRVLPPRGPPGNFF